MMTGQDQSGERPDVEAILSDIRKHLEHDGPVPDPPEDVEYPGEGHAEKPWCPLTLARKVIRRLRTALPRRREAPAPPRPSFPEHPGETLEERIRVLEERTKALGEKGNTA
jgi:hypothetical protein